MLLKSFFQRWGHQRNKSESLQQLNPKYEFTLDFFNKEEMKEIDMTHKICEECGMNIKYSRNITNMRTHLTLQHPEIALALAKGGKVDNKSATFGTFTIEKRY